MIDSNDVYAQKNLGTAIMFQGDTNHLLPYKTNNKVGNKAQMGLNHSVYIMLWLTTKFDVNKCGFVTFSVLDDLKCHNVTHLMKSCHI